MTLNPFRALQRHPNFRLFLAGQSVSLVGTWMQQVAVGWTALELTNDVFLVGLVSAAGSFPVLFFSLYAGVLADRVDRRRVLIVAQSLLLLEATALWWLAWTGAMTFPWLLALTTFNGVVGSVEIPMRQAMIGELVSREDVLDAVALNSSAFNLARVIGPAIAATTIARFGIAGCFGLNALSYFAVLISLGRLRLVPRAIPAVTTSPLVGLQQGIAYIRATRPVAAIMWLVAAFSILGFPYLALLPVIARDVLGTGAAGYGLLLTCVGVGAVAGALALAAAGSRIRRGRLLQIAMLVFGAALIGFSFTRHVVAAGALLLLIGIAMILSSALCNAMLQTITPDHLRGRVISAYVFLYVGLSPVGALLGGAVARAASAPWAVGGGAAIMLVFALWTFARVPELRSY